MSPAVHSQPAVLTCGTVATLALHGLFARYQLRLTWVGAGATIPGSYWGEPEAGLVGRRLLVRPDTPVHSALHEACHFVCMDASRRDRLHTDAGGDTDEENGVCYLQIVLADQLPGVGRERIMRDMDAWGYSFRLGSTARWFRYDAADARAWLRARDLIDADELPTWRLNSFENRGTLTAI